MINIGAAAIVGAALGLYSAHRQAQAASDAADTQAKAIEEASKAKATDIVQSTESKTVESPSLGSANRQSKRRGKSALTIDRPTSSTGTSAGTGLQI